MYVYTYIFTSLLTCSLFIYSWVGRSNRLVGSAPQSKAARSSSAQHASGPTCCADSQRRSSCTAASFFAAPGVTLAARGDTLCNNSM